MMLTGDCLALLPAIHSASVDAIVTDPPYGLGFMGKNWDHGVPGEPFWREALRVAKPGAHLLAFGGTRTFHRLTCAIEDAGWEIRDCLSWLYGSGFPKSLDVSKAMDKRGGADIAWFGPWLRQERERRGITQKSLAVHFPSKTGGMTGCVANWELGFNLPTVEQFNTLCEVLALPFSRIEEAEREVIGERERAGKPPQYMWGEEDGQKWNETAPATDLARQWAGWGTALKPAWEPIILARKPLVGTVAANVSAHGTGALNIAATRIIATDGKSARAGHAGKESPVHVFGPTHMHAEPDGLGRWPANVVLSHTDECREVGVRKVKGHAPERLPRRAGSELGQSSGWNDHANRDTAPRPGHADADGLETVPAWDCAPGCPVRLLDEQSGNLRARGNVTPTKRQQSNGSWGANGVTFGVGPDGPIDYGDTGGASRFFYTAKASRAEREAGLGGGERKAKNWNSGDQNPGSFQAAGTDRTSTNHHPTVKPIELMRWLCRLVTPPGGLILDPFAGSGSTGCAAVLEGFRFLGMEREPEYAEIARRRIAYWESLHQPSLDFGGVA